MYAAEWPCCHDPLRFSLGSDDLSPLARQPRQLPKRARALQGARCFRPAPRARRTRATDSFSCARAPSIFLPNSVGVSPTFYQIPSNHHVNDHLLLLLTLTHVAHYTTSYHTLLCIQRRSSRPLRMPPPPSCATENHHLNPAPLLALSLSLAHNHISGTEEPIHIIGIAATGNDEKRP